MKRSTSYLATASAMRSVPSTCTSSRSKFLSFVREISVSRMQDNKLGRVVTAHKVVNNIRVPYALLKRWGISEIVFLQGIRGNSKFLGLALTMNITLPRSPETFKWRFAISSRKGTITVHPCLAKLLVSLWPRNYYSVG
jgi:hypothetical protein